MNTNNHSIRKLISESRYQDKLKSVMLAKEKSTPGIDFKYWKEEANCCGCLAYTLDKVELFKNYTRELDLLDVLKLPKQINSFPGYIPPRAGLRFIKLNCREIHEKEMKIGDIVLFMERRYWCHAGVYVGDIENKRIMFHKDGVEGDFSFDDLDFYVPSDRYIDKSFHSVR